MTYNLRHLRFLYFHQRNLVFVLIRFDGATSSIASKHRLKHALKPRRFVCSAPSYRKKMFQAFGPRLVPVGQTIDFVVKCFDNRDAASRFEREKAFKLNAEVIEHNSPALFITQAVAIWKGKIAQIVGIFSFC